jgi:hypothetical protein
MNHCLGNCQTLRPNDHRPMVVICPMIPGQRRRACFVAICPANQRQTSQRYNSLELLSLSFTHGSVDSISISKIASILQP